MPIQSPFRYEDDRDEESSLAGSDSPLTKHTGPQMNAGAPQVQQRPMTFAQMQAQGQPRPPMPSARPPQRTLPGGPERPRPQAPSGGWTDAPMNQPPSAPAQGGQSTNDLLERLLAGMRGEGQGGRLRGEVNEALLEQLNADNPYNSEAVRSEYDYLAGNIDDDFAQRERATDEAMAARGLYGSSGKDFHSGRLSDLNVGRRTAKTDLAHGLASDYARSAADYRRDAISQAMAGADAANNDEMEWLMALFGFGQQGFENDLATARFNQDQNRDYEDFLQQLLAFGYA